MSASPVLQPTPVGLYCAAGDFYIDPWPRADREVARAVITHGHADHARAGAGRYFCGATVSLHSAGHVLGSAQVRVEVDGEVWVVTGDFKRADDPTCTPFAPVQCDTLVTEATFGLPIYRWRPGREVVADLHDWWQRNAARGRTSVLFCYAFGKAQRVLAELLPLTSKTVYLHGAIAPLVRLYRDLGVDMVSTRRLSEAPRDLDMAHELVLAPPSAAGSPWMRRFTRHATGFVSGWMQVRGNRRRRGYDRGFVMSDHADWPGLLQTIEDSRATRVLATHGRTDVLVRYLREAGLEAHDLEMAYGDEDVA